MYKRIVLKLSGEALAGEKKGVTFDDSIIWGLIAQIKAVMAKGTQVSLVIGGGNFWRGRSADSKMDRTKADQIGMLATVMNAIYVADAFRQNGILKELAGVYEDTEKTVSRNAGRLKFGGMR